MCLRQMCLYRIAAFCCRAVSAASNSRQALLFCKLSLPISKLLAPCWWCKFREPYVVRLSLPVVQRAVGVLLAVNFFTSGKCTLVACQKVVIFRVLL